MTMNLFQSVLHDFNNTISLKETEESEEKIIFDIAYSALQTSKNFFTPSKLFKVS